MCLNSEFRLSIENIHPQRKERENNISYTFFSLWDWIAVGTSNISNSSPTRVLVHPKQRDGADLHPGAIGRRPSSHRHHTFQRKWIVTDRGKRQLELVIIGNLWSKQFQTSNGNQVYLRIAFQRCCICITRKRGCTLKLRAWTRAICQQSFI